MPCTKAWLHQQLEINGNCYTELIPRELSVIYEEQTSRSMSVFLNQIFKRFREVKKVEKH